MPHAHFFTEWGNSPAKVLARTLGTACHITSQFDATRSDQSEDRGVSCCSAGWGNFSSGGSCPGLGPPSASYLFHSPPQEVEQLSSCFIPSGTVGIEEENETMGLDGGFVNRPYRRLLICKGRHLPTLKSPPDSPELYSSSLSIVKCETLVAWG
jgi:hypothetical protein